MFEVAERASPWRFKACNTVIYTPDSESLAARNPSEYSLDVETESRAPDLRMGKRHMQDNLGTSDSRALYTDGQQLSR